MFKTKNKMRPWKKMSAGGNGGGRSNSNNTMTWKGANTSKNTGKTSLIGSLTKGSMNAENMYNAVVLQNKPDYYQENYEHEKEEIHEWWAENTVDFFNEINVILNVVTEDNEEWQKVVKKPEDFPNHGYPADIKYYWKNPGEEPKELPISVYVDHVMIWINATLENEDVFPTDEDIPFPDDFLQYMHKIYKRLFRIFAIIYSNPCLLKKVGGDTYLDLAFRHFLYFCWKWQLLKDEETKCISSHVKPIKKKFERDQKLYLEHKLPIVQISKHTKKE